MKRQSYLKPWIFSIILAFIIVSAEGLLKIYPPSAYVFCLTGHTRDMINTILNSLADTRFSQTMLSRKYLIITSPAVIFGAWAAARIYRERKVQKPEKRFTSFFLGFTVMLTGTVIFGCPVRIVIRSGYGEWYGLIALAGLITGIAAASLFLRWRWSR